MENPVSNKINVTLGMLLNIPAVRQLIFLAGLAVSIALGFYIYSSIQEPNYRPVNYHVTSQNMAAIADTLDKAGIAYKISGDDGILYVDANDVQEAKLKLTSAGVAKDDGLNFTYLNEQGNIGNSQFLENARYLRALEGDLSKTIMGIEGISGARVHIAIPQGNVFADETQHPSASILVNMAPGLSSDQEKIRAIVNIVSSSVPGLDQKYVTITDQSGHFLTGALSEDSIFNTKQLQYQNNLQSYYEKRIETMITPLIGDNSVNVRVQATIDFTQNEEANEKYDPQQSVIRSEETSSESDSASGASGAPGSLANTPDEGGEGKSSGSSGSSSGRSQSIKKYEVSKTVTYRKISSPRLINLSAAVVIDAQSVLDPKTNKYSKKPLDKATLDKVTELVKTTIGFDEKRGDKVTVINSAFAPSQLDAAVEKPSFIQQPWFWVILKKTITILIGLLVFFFAVRKLFNYAKTINKHVAPNELSMDGGSAVTSDMLQLKQEQINRLKELASRDPNRVSVVIKSWVEK